MMVLMDFMFLSFFAWIYQIWRSFSSRRIPWQPPSFLLHFNPSKSPLVGCRLLSSASMTSESHRPVDLERWMTNLPDEIANRPIFELKIPGSHDTGATPELSHKHPIANDEKGFVAKVGKLRYIRKGIRRWAITQDLPIYEQLVKGIRYFDLRVSQPPPELRAVVGDYVLVHALYGPRFDDFLYNLYEFLMDNPREVVILDINHLFGMDCYAVHSFIYHIFNMIGEDKFCPVLPRKQCTLRYCQDNGHQIILLMPFYSEVRAAPIWTQQRIKSMWPNTNQTSKLFPMLEDNLRTSRPAYMDCFFVTQCVLTATLKNVILHWLSSLELVLGDKTKAMAIEWLSDNNNSELLKLVNIVITDVVDEDFSQTVIRLNYSSMTS